jgi:hypothetical protein
VTDERSQTTTKKQKTKTKFISVGFQKMKNVALAVESESKRRMMMTNHQQPLFPVCFLLLFTCANGFSHHSFSGAVLPTSLKAPPSSSPVIAYMKHRKNKKFDIFEYRAEMKKLKKQPPPDIILGRYHVTPVELFRVQKSFDTPLREFNKMMSERRKLYDFVLHDNGLVQPTIGDKYIGPNGNIYIYLDCCNSSFLPSLRCSVVCIIVFKVDAHLQLLY